MTKMMNRTSGMRNSNKYPFNTSIGERIVTFKNKMNGEVIYSSNRYKPRFVDGVEYAEVFKASSRASTFWMRLDALKRIDTVSY